MVNCDVICDLMEIYHSGEASKATKKLVEEHLEECKQCVEKFNQSGQAEQVLAELSQTETPTNGMIFITRLKRLVFGFSMGFLFLLSFILVLISRFFFVDFLGLSMQELVIEFPIWLIFVSVIGYGAALYFLNPFSDKKLAPCWVSIRILTLLLFGAAGLYTIKIWGGWANLICSTLWLVLFATLSRRVRTRPASSSLYNNALIFESIIPFLLIGFSLSIGGMQSFYIASLFLLIAVIFAIKNIPHIWFIPRAATLTMFIITICLALTPGKYTFGVLDVLPISSQALGAPTSQHPLEYILFRELEEGLNFTTGQEDLVTHINGISFEDADAYKVKYVVKRSHEMKAVIIAAKFEDQQGAKDFMDQFKEQQADKSIAFSIDLGTANQFLYDDNFIRIYNDEENTAYNLWQDGEWVTIISVEGQLFEAVPMANDIRQLVSGRYNYGYRGFPIINRPPQ